ncbi:unnamed protein product [Alternaria alternata]|nr:hypothetical protein AA0116_g12373 [Alternaria tenuissima]
MVEHWDFSDESFDADQHDYAVHPPSTAYETLADEAIDHTLNEVYLSPRTKQQDQAISFMLEVSTRDYLLQWTESFIFDEHAGYNHCLSIISEIPAQDRAKRFAAIESLLVRPMSAPLINHNREPQPGAVTYSQGRSHERTSTSSRESESVAPKRYGCLGQQGSCPEHRYLAWRSFLSFFKHIQAKQLAEFEAPGGRLECLKCAKWNNPSKVARYPPFGRELAQHIWDDYMTYIPG